MTDYLPTWWSPTVDVDAVDSVAARLDEAGLDVRRSQPLGRLTTLGVGGPARVFVEPRERTELLAVTAALAPTAEADVPLLVLGRGSNLLVADSGWPGLVVRLGAGLKSLQRDGSLVTAGGGASMPGLAAWCATERLAGLEFAAGIPATVGGSVRMNAGAHGGEMADRLVSVDLALPGAGLVTLPAGDLGFGYRRSALPPRSVVAAATWQLVEEDADVIRGRLDELRAWRRATQPLRQRNCGSVFTNPAGDSAGRLVDAAGLKGHRRGGAHISHKHANFVVVDPGCRAADVIAVIADARRIVHEAGGPLLEPEVRVVGDFSREVAGAGA